jgi:hypothetical protein
LDIAGWPKFTLWPMATGGSTVFVNDQLRRDGPNTDIDRIVCSVKENGGRISNKLVGEFPMLADLQVASDLREAIASAFDTINPGPVANESARLR